MCKLQFILIHFYFDLSLLFKLKTHNYYRKELVQTDVNNSLEKRMLFPFTH